MSNPSRSPEIDRILGISGEIDLTDTLLISNVSTHEATILDEFSQSDVYQLSAVRLLQSFLFGRGLVVKPSKEVEQNEEALDYMVSEYWGPFLKEVVVNWLKFGYCVWTKVQKKEKIKGGKAIVFEIPVVVPRSLYVMRIITTKTFERLYEVRSMRINPTMDLPDASLQLCFMVGHEPDQQTGVHRSVAAALYYPYMRLVHMQKITMQAFHQRAHPPIVLEEVVDKQKELPDTRINFAESMFPRAKGAEGDGKLPPYEMLAQAKTQALAERGNILELGAEPRSGRYYTDLEDEKEMHNAKKQRFVYTQTTEDNVFFVPAGWKVSTSRLDLPEPIADIIKEEEIYRDKVYAIYNIPVALSYAVISSRSGNASSMHIDDGDKQRLNHTLRDIQRRVVQVGKEVYAYIFDDNTGNAYVDLPLVPNASPSQILTFMDQSIIGTDTGKETLADLAGIAPDKVLYGENVITRPPIGGNENSTSLFMDVRAQNIMADTKLKLANAKKSRAEAEVVGEEEAGVDTEGEMKMLDKELELEEKKHEAKIEEMEMQITVLNAKLAAEKEKLKITLKADKEKTTNEIKRNKSKPKPSAAAKR